MTWRVLEGDVRDRLSEIPDGSVQCCVTSPPYFGLRDYGHNGQIGLDTSPSAYVDALVSVFGGVRRTLRDDGTCWLNLGDSYANDGKWGGHTGGKHVAALHCSPIGRNKRYTGLKPKDLIGVPWRVAFALQADGWYLRSDIIWSKPNPMPESVQDRPTKAHEYLFLLSKSPRYFYDGAAIREPYTGQATKDYAGTGAQNASDVKRRIVDKQRGHGRRHAGFNDRWDAMPKDEQQMTGANKRSVWQIATHPFPGAHFAVMPEKLVEPCILAGSRPGDLVLDPFTGAGTVGAVAIRHQRSFVGVELNPAYVEIARARIGDESPLFASEVS
jgi:DNA modification methylase